MTDVFHHPIDRSAILNGYCDRNGIRPSSFGQLIVGDSGFPLRLQRGTAALAKWDAAQRFMSECPEIPHRQFGAVAKAWRERVAAEQAANSGAGHDGVEGDVGVSTAATVAKPADPHNQESHNEVTP